jgi:predicted permease
MRLPWNRSETELNSEVAHHLNELTAEYERRGHSHREALLMARREFGGADQFKEQCRDERRFSWTVGLGKDIAFGVRQIRRSPAFAATAVLTLALGIAANVIVFGVLQEMVLNSINVPHGERVMTLQLSNSPFPFIAWPEVRDVRDSATQVSAVAAFNINNFGLEVNGATRPVWGYEVSGQYFEVCGIKPLLGRLLTRADDDHAGASDAAVISWSAWKTWFGGDPAVVGQTIRLNKHTFTIVGVTPEDFNGTEKFLKPTFFVPLADAPILEFADWLEQRRAKHVFAVVRLKENVTVAQADAELKAIANRVRRQYPVDEETLGYKLVQAGLVGNTLGGPARSFMGGLMALAGIVLLAACVNLGGLFAARTADRAREIAIRLAIGSSRWRILRQLVVEAVLISLIGGVAACSLAWLALNSLAAWHPPTDYPVNFAVAPQPSLILVALLISVAAGLAFGLMPLRQIFRTDPNQAIKSGGIQSFAGRRWALRDVLLAAQVALCCVTVTAAFVSLRGLGRTMTMDLGFQPKGAVITKFELTQAGYSAEATDRFQRQLLERVSNLPGVQAAAYANTTPLKGDLSSTDIFSGQTNDFRPSNKQFSSFMLQVSPGYFTAAGTPLLGGRDFSFADSATTPPVAVVNREFARRLFPGADPIGRFYKTRSGKVVQIVGVVADGKYLAVAEDPKPAVFYPIAQQPSQLTALIVRPRRDAPEMAATIRKLIHDLDPDIAIRESGDWFSLIGFSFLPSRVATVALGLFGAFGLLLSIAGTFGLASYTVSKRMREMSLRVALGAQAKQLLAAALGRMMVLLGVGSLIGIALGVAASKVLAVIVYHASAQDPVVLVAVAMTMASAGLLSVAGPVRRALRADPAAILREQ